MSDFEARVMPEPNSGCDIWLGPVIDKNAEFVYGRYWIDGHFEMAHHFPFRPVPEGYEVHHKCRNTLCVRKEHLQVVTKKEHRQAEGRSNGFTFACGHEKTKENTHVGKHGWQYCRTCDAKRHRDARASRLLQDRS